MPDIHLPIGTSSVHRVMACPASYQRGKVAPRGNTSGAASEGTMLHTVMEAVYADDKEAKDLVGDTFNDDLTFTEDMRIDQILPAIAATEKLLTSSTLTNWYLSSLFSTCLTLLAVR